MAAACSKSTSNWAFGWSPQLDGNGVPRLFHDALDVRRSDCAISNGDDFRVILAEAAEDCCAVCRTAASGFPARSPEFFHLLQNRRRTDDADERTSASKRVYIYIYIYRDRCSNITLPDEMPNDCSVVSAQRYRTNAYASLTSQAQMHYRRGRSGGNLVHTPFYEGLYAGIAL